MPNPIRARAILFDYGNTLIEFGPAQVEATNRRYARELQTLFGEFDYDRFVELRKAALLAPYAGEFRENDLRRVNSVLVRDLFGVFPTDAQLQQLLHVKYRSVVDVIEAPEYLPGFLDGLRSEYKLGLVSNYVDALAIRHSLRRIGIEDFFDVIVVSADVGHVKPHPRPFAVAMDWLEMPPSDALFVGDNWLGDIQGSKRFGMRAAWTRQFAPYEKFEPQPGDHPADVELGHLLELTRYLD